MQNGEICLVGSEPQGIYFDYMPNIGNRQSCSGFVGKEYGNKKARMQRARPVYCYFCCFGRLPGRQFSQAVNFIIILRLDYRPLPSPLKIGYPKIVNCSI
jgi:hypothetical protein